MKKIKIFNSLILTGLLGVTSAAFGIGRTVTIDDAPGFNSSIDQQVRGIQWNSNIGGNFQDMRNDGTLVQSATFDLKIGTSTIATGQSFLATENGQLYFGDQSVPLANRGFVSLFQGTNLYSSSPTQYKTSVGIPSTQFGYSLGEFGSANGTLLQPTGLNVGPPFDGLAPGGENRINHFVWFGLTGEVDPCSSATIEAVYDNPGTYNNSYTGTPCANHVTTPRYFGSIDIVDVGTREDGDFDLLLNFGTPYTFRANPTTFTGAFSPARSLFGSSPLGLLGAYSPGGLYFPTDFAQTIGPTSTSGFILGNQKFEFDTYDANSSPYEFRFRGGVACAVIYDANGNETGCSRVTQLGDPPNDVPIPGVALLLLLGGFGLARLRYGSKKD
jgi:hypothetical protein